MFTRNKHKLTNLQVGTFSMGNLVPIGMTEILPGDSIEQKTDSVIRTLPLLAPPMHEVEIIITHTYTPFRLIWEEWEDFITGGKDGLNASVLPTIDFSGSPVTKGSLAHYLGLPVGFASTASALPFRAYAKFYNDHILDEEKQTELVIDLSSGSDTTTNTTLQRVNWAKDRFTGSQTNEQLGAAISIPLGTTAPIHGNSVEGTGYIGVVSDTTGNLRRLRDGGAGAYIQNVNATNGAGLYANLSNASSATINQLREAIALQKFAEMRQIYGSTYEKMVQADFGVRPKDERLGNSEILSTGRGLLQFSEVLATAETGSSVDVGDMKGHAIAAVKTNKYRAFFPEHGYLISYVTIRPKPIYTQGIPRHWIKDTREDFYTPMLEHMGMQPILNKEVKHNHATPNAVFSYEPVYNEYRHAYNRFFGEMTDLLKYWHLGREFSTDPALNSSFITCTPTDRIFAQSATDNILGMFKHHIAARRLVKNSVRPVGLI